MVSANAGGLGDGGASPDAEGVAGAAAVSGSVGAQLRAAREAMGMSIEALSERTRISRRHLLAIENGDYAALPGRTYITGFTRAYAREVGVDEVSATEVVRADLRQLDLSSAVVRETYTPADPARLPGRTLAWTALGIVLLASLGYALWRSSAVPDGAELAQSQLTAPAPAAPVATASGASRARAANAAPVATDAEVTITASSEVWVGFDDASGRTVAYRTLDADERYVVPAQYRDTLTFRTVRPQAVSIAVAGRPVGTLGVPDRLVKGISLKPADLAARANGAPAAGATSPALATSPAPGAARVPVTDLPPTRPGAG